MAEHKLYALSLSNCIVKTAALVNISVGENAAVGVLGENCCWP